MSAVLLNICLFPPEEVAQQCVKISQSFPDEQVRFKLGDGLFPHSTVYMARFNDEALTSVVNALQNLISTISAPEFKHTGYFLTDGGYVEASYQRTPALLSFQKQVIESLKDLRGVNEPPKESYYGPYSAEQRGNVKQTGYDLAYDLYRPHITFTRYKEDATPKKLPPLPDINLSFKPEKLALYEADENGAIFKEISIFNF